MGYYEEAEGGVDGRPKTEDGRRKFEDGRPKTKVRIKISYFGLPTSVSFLKTLKYKTYDLV